MPPQPLSSVRSGVGFTLTADGFDQRPAVAEGIALCIAQWSWADTQKQRLFIVLLGANHDAGARMYNSLNGVVAKDSALKSLAIAKLDQRSFKVLEDLLRYIKSQQAIRDKIAHWMWGISPDLPDGMILIDPRFLIAQQANITATFTNGKIPNYEHIKIPDEKVYYYSAGELIKDAKTFGRLAELINKSWRLAVAKKSEELDQLCHELETDARLAPYISR